MSLSPTLADAANEGAGATPGESSPPAEAPESEQTPGIAGESLSPKPGEKPSLESGAPSEAAGKEEQPPFHTHPRWKEVTSELGQARQELETLKPQLEQAQPFIESLERHGIYEPQQLDSLVEDSRAFNYVNSLMEENPIQFASEMRRLKPEAYGTMAVAIHQSMLEQRVAVLRKQGDHDRAAILEEEMEAWGNETWSRGPRSSPQLSRERQEIERQRQQLDGVRRAEFDKAVNGEIGARITKEIDRLTAGIEFPGAEAKESIYDLITHRLDEAADSDADFQQEIERMMGPQGGYGPNHREAVVRRYVARALQGGNLERLVANTLKALSLNLQKGETQRKENLQNASATGDAGTGAPPSGKLSGAALEKHLEALRRKGATPGELAEAIVLGNM